MTSDAQSHYPHEIFSRLALVEADHWWFRARNRLLLYVLNKKVIRFSNFLEIGCGTGFVLQGIRIAFPNVKIYGSEYFEEGLNYARKRVPDAKFRQLDVCEMIEKEAYDVIGAFDVIEHIDRDEVALTNMVRALRSKGSLLITVPQHRWLWSVVDEHACHIRRYTRSELLEKVQATGLKVEYVSSFVFLLMPLMLLSRLRTIRADYEPMSEFEIPGWLNSLLEGVMNIELLFLKIGIRFPVGGSLLLLGRKRT